MIVIGHAVDIASPFRRLPIYTLLSSSPPMEEATQTSQLDGLSDVSAFKYRMWFMRHVIHVVSRRRADSQRALWLQMVEGTDLQTDLWLWKDESDEEYLKTLDLSAVVQWREDFWDIATALRTREWTEGCRTSEPGGSLAHLSPPERARVIGWFITVAAGRKGERVEELISRWAKASSVQQGQAGPYCVHCNIPNPVLRSWTQTMMHVYSLDDIRSIPWRVECKCLQQGLAHFLKDSNGISIPELQEPKAAAALAFIYELAVPPWPLILWVVFRTSADKQTDCFPAFLEFLRSPTTRDIVTWDDEDSTYLFRILVSHNDNRDPGSWSIYSAWRSHVYESEIAPNDWLLVRKVTYVAARSRGFGSEAAELNNRICALLLALSSDTITALEDPAFLAPLEIRLSEEPFWRVARIMNGQLENEEVVLDFERVESWNASSLEQWLGQWSHKQTYAPLLAKWSSTSPLKRLEYLSIVARCAVSQNLLAYTFIALLQNPWTSSDQDLHELYQSAVRWANQTELECLIAYSSFLGTLLTFLKRCYKATSSIDSNMISKEVSMRLKDDFQVVSVRLVRLLGYQDLRKEFLAFRDTDAQALLDLLQHLLDQEQFLVIRPVLFEALCRLSDNSGLHPACFALTDLKKVGDQVAAGGFGDVWKGTVYEQSVSVKVMRVFQESDVQAVLKEFRREALIWRQLCHPNLLPFYGVYYLENRLCIVSPWMDNGNILEYVKKNSLDTGRQLSLMLDVALGVEYLHNNRIVHGDLKAINILVTPSQRACIVDFGLSCLAESIALRFTHTTASVRGGTARYQAPELLNANRSHYGSDIYAYAHVCYEILTGKVPFFDIFNDAAVIFKILDGYKPERLAECRGSPVLDELWELLQHCWKNKSEERPSATEIVQRLVGPSIQASTTYSQTDWDEKFSSKFRRSLQVESLIPSVTRTESILFGDVDHASATPSFNSSESGPSTSSNNSPFPVLAPAPIPSAHYPIYPPTPYIPPLETPPGWFTRPTTPWGTAAFTFPGLRHRSFAPGSPPTPGWGPPPQIAGPFTPPPIDHGWSSPWIPPWAEELRMPHETSPLIKTQLRNSRFGVDRVGRFDPGPHYGPVLEPIHVRTLQAHIQIHPLMQPHFEQHDDKLRVEWNMLFPSTQCQSSDGIPLNVAWSQSHGDEPATFPRLTQLRLVSDMFPWHIDVIAGNSNLGVTCSEVVARIDVDLHQSTLQNDYEVLPAARKRVVQAAYKRNRSSEDGVPGRQLTPAMLRLDWLGGDTLFGGVRENKTLVRSVCGEVLPCTFELVRMGEYPVKVGASDDRDNEQEGE